VSADPAVRGEIVGEPFDLGRETALVRSAARNAGGLVAFLGCAREFSRGKRVIGLSFEAYREMAGPELTALAAEARERFRLTAAAVLHRVGEIAPGEDIVLIIVAAEHREEAFAGCRFLIDELKRRIPIWKKEIYDDGEVWIQETP
jgi:molybdopterin synthase catalytic subunit